MNDKYKIIDERLNEDFKLKTFSGFQKKMFKVRYLKQQIKVKQKMLYIGVLNVFYQDIL